MGMVFGCIVARELSLVRILAFVEVVAMIMMMMLKSV
jgi:hypothetical protein